MITNKEVKECLDEFEILISNIHNKTAYEYLEKYIEEQETFTLKVKRYFVLKGNLTSEELLSEYRELTKQILEELGLSE
jgi:hypothetical protein